MSRSADRPRKSVVDQPDWSREARTGFFEWSPYKSLLAAIRCYQRHRHRRGIVSAVCRRVATVRWRLWSIIGGISIPLRCQIGGGLYMAHTNGIVINADAKIGHNCEIFQQVTLGEANGGFPTIGNNVSIGPGAKVLGPVTIGDGARIGANALVVRDVPAGALVLAAPAEIHGSALTANPPTG